MKTAIKTIIASAFTAIVLTSSAFAATANTHDQVTTLSDVRNINDIKVSGNVELILIQSNTESVKVYDNYYSKNAFVQQQGGSLYISSFDKEKLTVVAYVNNLKGIEATDNATVVSKGELNLLSLDVKLKNNATAKLNLSVINLNTTVSGQSDLTVAGSADTLFASMNSISKLNIGQLKSQNTVFQSDNKVIAHENTSDIDPMIEGLGK